VAVDVVGQTRETENVRLSSWQMVEHLVMAIWRKQRHAASKKLTVSFRSGQIGMHVTKLAVVASSIDNERSRCFLPMVANHAHQN